MDVEVPVLSGYVVIPQQSGFSIKPITKKKSPKYCMLFKASRHGMERLEIGDSETDKNAKIMTLENCVKITQEPAPANLIHILTKTGSLTMNPTTEEELKQWLTALQQVAFKEKAEPPHAATLMRTTSGAAIEEDNDLYCSSYDGVFAITLVKTEASQRCNIPEKTYKLSLGATDLLLEAFDDDKKLITKWPYRFIRKYGYRDGHFTFEAGRKCDTGEGNFILDHASPQEIFRCLATKMKSMKKMLHSGDGSLNADETQLSVAVSSMEAGSRSPIPLFPTTPSSDFDINSASSAQLHHSFASVRGFLSSVDSLNNSSSNNNNNNNSSSCNSSSHVSTTSSSIPLLKHIPNKPPRKTLVEPQEKLPELPKRNAPPTATGPREYECIESITDAWRTMGIDEVRHTENVKEEHRKETVMDLPLRTMAGKKESLMLDTKLRPGKKLVEITQESNGWDGGDSGDENAGDDGPEGNYDHLDYFRSNSKISSAYKTVIPISPPPAVAAGQSPAGVSLTQIPTATTATTPTKKPTTANDDYEIIGTPPPAAIDMKKCRPADDSHLGYGVLRRPVGLPLPPTPTSGGGGGGMVLVVKKSPGANEANKTLLLENNNNGEVLLKNSAILLTTAAGDATALCEKRMEMLANGELVEDVDDVLGHRKFNGLDYAIVSKPKRV